jgi:hypothetical protein
MARRPQTLAEAHEYIGSSVRKWFTDPPGWYNGVVTAVKAVSPDKGQAGRDIWYYVE